MNGIVRILLLALLSSPLLAQERPRKPPVLIRDEPPEESMESVAPDPLQAEESLKIGEFYYKRKNYKAAASRFREAARYLPTWAKPYERLVEALRKMEAWQKAIDACDLFLATNPDHEEAGKFEKLADEVRRERGKKGPSQ